jgi:hypothetical protein
VQIFRRDEIGIRSFFLTGKSLIVALGSQLAPFLRGITLIRKTTLGAGFDLSASACARWAAAISVS